MTKRILFLSFFAVIAITGFAQTYEIIKVSYEKNMENGKFGIIEIEYDISNKKEVETERAQILPCEYSEIYFYEGMAMIASVGIKTDCYNNYKKGAKWAIYDYSKGIFATPFKYDKIHYFGEGLAACNVGGKYVEWENTAGTIDCDISGGLWGYVDCRTGNEIIPPQYETAGEFRNGVAMVSKDGTTTLLQNPLLASDVDINIPVADRKNEETFAFIFANQDYANFSVPFARNDGRIFKEYCAKTLGVPEKNIRFYENATIGNMMAAINKIKEYADVYDGDARFIVYYSGQGMTDGNTKIPYLLPVDAVLTNLSATGYSVEKLNRELSEIQSKSCLLVLDASFNGMDREGKMLTAARGVAIKAKPNHADGSLIVFSASTGDETAYQYTDKNHGLFTYFLLKKLQETQGNISYRELTDYVAEEVKKQSVSNPKTQSPNIVVSEKLTNWQTLKIK
jgi:hypothetical protein